MRSPSLLFLFAAVVLVATALLIRSKIQHIQGNHLQVLSTDSTPSSSQHNTSQLPAFSSGTTTGGNWTLYQNKHYGYQIAYPPDWQIVDTTSVANIRRISAPDGAELKITQNAGDHGISPCIRVTERRRITVGGTAGTEDVFRYAIEPGEKQYINCGAFGAQAGHIAQINCGIVHNGNNVLIEFFPSKHDEDDVRVFNAILSTFHF